MNLQKHSQRLWLYTGLFVVALFMIFFVGTEIDTQTGKSRTVLTANGLSHFKKGLDIAGGVRLTYKIDFSKYEEVYTNETELLQVKKMAQDIILKNIDSRISKLGVSDYSAYIQQLTDGEYLIVEIGGLNDIDEAKAIIGKTVELEFKLANDVNEGSPELYAQRQAIAEEMLAEVTAAPDTFEQAGTGKGSSDIFYAHYTDATLEQLPDIYRNNPQLLLSLTPGAIYPTLLTDIYHTITQEDGSGATQTKELKGFTILKFNGVKTVKLDAIEPQRVVSVAKERGIDVNVERSKTVIPASTGVVTYANNTVTYVGPEVLQGQSGFDIVLYQVLNSGAAQSVADTIKAGKIPAATAAKSLADGWVDGGLLASQMLGFDPSVDVKIYQQLEGAYVLHIRDRKDVSETVAPTVNFAGMTNDKAQKLITDLQNASVYDIEDIRVQDTQTWITAKDPKTNDILNGAFFKFANVGQGQTGKPVVSINFDDKGKEIFCNITEAYIGKQMAIFVGGNLMTAPVIQDKICGGSAQIDGTFDSKSAKALTDELNAGALPAPLLLSHEEKVSPTLGEFALRGAFLSSAIGFVIIYLLMFRMYGWKKANIVILTLIAFVAFLMAIFKLIGIVASLSAIAAAILTVGIAVDANVLIFERLREELKDGKSITNAINDAADRSRAPIRDGNISIGLIGLLLFTMGVNVFKGFGTTILINMFLILLVSVPLTKELLHIFYKKDK